ncbi:hypothetical protein RCC89_09475 [Cytophagaceae bacterium ABcell3]|nr:hypothetical protein RCC89_09475 [Cytophagaceae bacterium ABcell3]
MEKVATRVHELIVVSKSRKEAYQAAANAVSDPSLHQKFEEFGLQNLHFISDIRYFSDYDESEEDPQQPLAMLWKDIMIAINNQGFTDKEDIKDACQKAEKETVKFFEQVYEDQLPPELLLIISKQLMNIKEAEASLKL